MKYQVSFGDVVDAFCELHEDSSLTDRIHLHNAARALKELPLIIHKEGGSTLSKKMVETSTDWEAIAHTIHRWLHCLADRSPYEFTWGIEVVGKLRKWFAFMNRIENWYYRDIFDSSDKARFTQSLIVHDWLFEVPNDYTLYNTWSPSDSLVAGAKGIVQLQKCHLSSNDWNWGYRFHFSDKPETKRDSVPTIHLDSVYGICPALSYFPTVNWEDDKIIIDDADEAKGYNCILPLSWIIGEIIPQGRRPYSSWSYLNVKHNHELFKLTDPQQLIRIFERS